MEGVLQVYKAKKKNMCVKGNGGGQQVGSVGRKVFFLLIQFENT